MNCRICSCEINEFIEVKEMVLGYRHKFLYSLCPSCHTIQIKELPEDLKIYYPNSYYSLSQIPNFKNFGAFKSKILILRDLHLYGIKKSLFGWLMCKLLPTTIEPTYLAKKFIYEQLRKNNKAKIHDAGCGTGQFLSYFHSLGYKNLSGSDPFLSESIYYGDYKVLNTELKNINDTFDVIILNHVFEHVIDPVAYLKTIYSKLNNSGLCLIRMPMAFSNGYKKYLHNWVGLEAPRHLHIFEKNGFINLAKQNNFEVYDIKYDAVGWHYFASEAYKNDISLNNIDSFNVDSASMKIFEAEAICANEKGEGDTCAYFLRKK